MGGGDDGGGDGWEEAMRVEPMVAMEVMVIMVIEVMVMVAW